MKDWVIRSVKTFVQAFFGVLIPAIGAMLNNGWPESLGKAWVILAPTVAAALSAAICAVWNIILEALEHPTPPVSYTTGPEIADTDERELDWEADPFADVHETYKAKHEEKVEVEE